MNRPLFQFKWKSAFDGATHNYTHQTHRLPIYFLEIFANLFKFKISKTPYKTSDFTKMCVMKTLQFERPLKRAFNRVLIFYANFIRVCEVSILLK